MHDLKSTLLKMIQFLLWWYPIITNGEQIYNWNFQMRNLCHITSNLSIDLQVYYLLVRKLIRVEVLINSLTVLNESVTINSLFLGTGVANESTVTMLILTLPHPFLMCNIFLCTSALLCKYALFFPHCPQILGHIYHWVSNFFFFSFRSATVTPV